MHSDVWGWATPRAWLCLVGMVIAPAWGQNPFDGQLKEVQGLDALSPTDDVIVENWVRWEVDQLRAGALQTPAFLADFARWRTDRSSSPALVTGLASQLGTAATGVFADAQVPAPVATTLARAVYDFGRSADLEAQLVGLGSAYASVRFLCAKGIANLRTIYAANANQLRRVSRALTDAGVKEKNAAVLAWIYKGLAIPGQATNEEVVGRILTVLTARVEQRRAGAVVVDGAELGAFEYFRATAGQLTPALKQQLAGILAVFLNGTAQRYAADDLMFAEQVNVERSLDAIESLLEGITGQAGGVRAALAADGRPGNIPAVKSAATAWIGSADVAGVLNGSPWNVPRGAP